VCATRRPSSSLHSVWTAITVRPTRSVRVDGARVGSARFLISGLYELTGSVGVEHAARIVGLVFVGVAAYVGFATLLEDSARRTILPIGRRGLARSAFSGGLDAQVAELEHEAGVREQL
jgi:uncharacterized protein